MKIETRSEYTRGELDRADLSPARSTSSRFGFSRRWTRKVVEPNAMSLATAGADERPLARTVLLKSYDERGFVFFTNFQSRKARQMAENANVSLLFPWLALERQVIVCGPVEKVSTAETLAYFITRPRGSQLGAWVSAQSSVITTRSLLEQKWEEMKRKFGEGQVPLPSFWGGYRVGPGRSSSGRAGPAGCTTVFFTPASPTAPGTSTGWPRDGGANSELGMVNGERNRVSPQRNLAPFPIS